jgi:GT2 family glycosyltransferase
MKNLSFSIILFFSFITSLVSQTKQDYIWLFGQDMSTSGFNGYIFNFNKPNEQVIEHDNNIGIGKANTSICDRDGNLQFYMNGCAVMNRNFEMMPDGDRLSYNVIWQLLNLRCDDGTVGVFKIT